MTSGLIATFTVNFTPSSYFIALILLHPLSRYCWWSTQASTFTFFSPDVLLVFIIAPTCCVLPLFKDRFHRIPKRFLHFAHACIFIPHNTDMFTSLTFHFTSEGITCTKLPGFWMNQSFTLNGDEYLSRQEMSCLLRLLICLVWTRNEKYVGQKPVLSIAPLNWTLQQPQESGTCSTYGLCPSLVKQLKYLIRLITGLLWINFDSLWLIPDELSRQKESWRWLMHSSPVYTKTDMVSR